MAKSHPADTFLFSYMIKHYLNQRFICLPTALEQDKAKASVWFWDREASLDSMTETGPLLQLRPTALRVDSFLTGLSWELFRGTSVSISETSTKTALGKTSVFVKHTILSELVPAHGQRSRSGRFCKELWTPNEV